MTVAELAALLLRLSDQSATVCLPAEPDDPARPDDCRDPHEVTGTSRWHGDYVGARHALIRGPYVRIDAMED